MQSRQKRENLASCTIETIGLYVVARISPFFLLSLPWAAQPRQTLANPISRSELPRLRAQSKSPARPRDTLRYITPRLYSCPIVFSPAPILAAAANRDRHEPTSTSFIAARRSAEAEGKDWPGYPAQRVPTYLDHSGLSLPAQHGTSPLGPSTQAFTLVSRGPAEPNLLY